MVYYASKTCHFSDFDVFANIQMYKVKDFLFDNEHYR